MLKIIGIMFLFGYSSVHAMPAQIVILRHAEKPAIGSELSPKGFERANALVDFIRTQPLINAFGPVEIIYAAGPPKVGGSIRSIQTITPYADFAQVQIQQQFNKNSVPELVRNISQNKSYLGKTVLICYEHSVIPDIATGFGVKNAPAWEDSVFDRVWLLRFNHGQTQFQDIPEHLLPGDSN